MEYVRENGVVAPSQDLLDRAFRAEWSNLKMPWGTGLGLKILTSAVKPFASRPYLDCLLEHAIAIDTAKMSSPSLKYVAFSVHVLEHANYVPWKSLTGVAEFPIVIDLMMKIKWMSENQADALNGSHDRYKLWCPHRDLFVVAEWEMTRLTTTAGPGNFTLTPDVMHFMVSNPEVLFALDHYMRLSAAGICYGTSEHNMFSDVIEDLEA